MGGVPDGRKATSGGEPPLGPVHIVGYRRLSSAVRREAFYGDEAPLRIKEGARSYWIFNQYFKEAQRLPPTYTM